MQAIANYGKEVKVPVTKLAEATRETIFNFNYPLSARVKKEDFEDPYEVLGFGDWFSSALIKNSKKIKYQKVGGNILFYKGDMKKTTVDFLRYILEDFISIDVTYLVIYLEDRYGIKMDKGKMLSFIKETDMYYSDTMEKVYLTKEVYYEDI